MFVDWIDIDRWVDCRQLQRPGYVFEIVNDSGQAIQTLCQLPLQWPEDWPPPTKFRLMVAPPPQAPDRLNPPRPAQ